MPIAAAWIWVVMAANPPLIFPPLESTLVFRLAITPAAVPAEKLKYELLPPRGELTKGNAALEYLRAAVLMPKERTLEHDVWTKRQEMLDRWRSLPPHRLPVERVKRELKGYEAAMKTADRAARFADCDWQIPRPFNLKTDAGGAPDIHPLRELISWLRFRIKVELAEGRLDDARRTLQTMFQMAKHVGDGPTLIRSLVGVAFAAIAVDAAAEWCSVTSSPNHYWALATLPEPLLDVRAMVAGEAEGMVNAFPGFVEFEKGLVSEERAYQIVESMRKDFQLFDDVTGALNEIASSRSGPDLNELVGTVFAFAFRTPPTEFEARVRRYYEDFAAVGRAPSARKWLRDRGIKDTEKMPHLQAAYLAAWLRYRERFDDTVVALRLPTEKAVRHAQAAAEANKKAIAESRDDHIARSLLIFVPAMDKVLYAHIRIRRQIAAVQAIEAIRAHLAVSGGELPKTWADVTVVPIPDDPLTGKPFEYTVEYGKAKLVAPPPVGEQETKSNSFRYELTVDPVK